MPQREAQLLEAAAEHLALRRYRDAHAACMEALHLNPESAQAYYLLGVLTADHANHRKASELFDRALALAPGRATYLAERARSRVALFDREGALDDARAAATSGRLSPRTLDTIGVVHSRLGQHADATPFFQRAVEREPDNPSFLYNLGSALQFEGEFAGAEAVFRRAISIEPGNVRAWSSLVAMQRQTHERNDILTLEALFAQLTDADDRLHIGHALAKAYEDLGDADAAMRWLGDAKAMKRLAAAYDAAEIEDLFVAATETVRAFVPSPTPASDEAPIFVVGLPRTGTTLVDRILSSHSHVASAGELSDFALEIKRAAHTTSPFVLDAETLRAVPRLELTAVGQKYLARARRVIGDTPRFLDKMPLNFFFAPAILRALPNARIICLRRNPADTVLSNYRQLFATSFTYYAYAYDLAWTADYYARFDRFVAACRESLPPDRFTEVAYEDIVSDIEEESRRLVSFCGLDWQDQCLAFHENAAPVATASSSQVRQPLYSTSLNRWRRYRDRLQPALDVLTAQGVKFE
jgi:tetratricopeptide (TPR) repeat protein